MKKITAAFLCLFAFSIPGSLRAQPAPVPSGETAAGPSAPASEVELKSVREELFGFLRMSPRLTMALSTDPSLLGYPDYVNRHNPGLAAFIGSHPEIARNPEFYLFAHLPGNSGGNVPFLFQRAVWPERGGGSNGDTMVAFVLLAILGAILWLLRLLMQNRRWNRVFRVQTEIHTKLLDKLSGNEELFHYLSSDAGRKFMELAPVSAALAQPGVTGGAAARILAPLQLGLVSTLCGAGILFVRRYLGDPQALLLVGTLALMLGIGLMLSAGISFILFRRLALRPGEADAD